MKKHGFGFFISLRGKQVKIPIAAADHSPHTYMKRKLSLISFNYACMQSETSLGLQIAPLPSLLLRTKPIW